jgi:hypothetical protein
MEFFNRGEELDELNRLEKDGSRMLVIYGKRRVGKTSLIKRLFDRTDARHIYLFVARSSKIDNLVADYLNLVKNELGLKVYEKAESFDELLQLLFEYSKKEKLIVAFDEFQNFLSVDPSAIDTLQKNWDLMHDRSNLSIIVSGSVVGMIKKIFVELNAPLFKRAYNTLNLKELDLQKTFQLMGILGVKGMKDKMELYFLFGGVIYYYALSEEYSVRSADDAISKLLMAPNAPLKNEVNDGIIEAFGKASPTYFLVLEAIANGKNTNNEIAAYAGIKETSLFPYIDDLKTMLGVINASGIATETQKSGSKRNRYFVDDSFYSFWFRFINKNLGYYEIGDFRALKLVIAEGIKLFNGAQFERVARELVALLNRKGTLGFEVNRIGRWWGKNPGREKGRDREEIDVVALNDKTGDILFAECKWTNEPVGPGLYSDLKRKSGLVQWHNDKRREHYALFSKSGFSAEMQEAAKKEGVLLFDLDAVERVLRL